MIVMIPIAREELFQILGNQARFFIFCPDEETSERAFDDAFKLYQGVRPCDRDSFLNEEARRWAAVVGLEVFVAALTGRGFAAPDINGIVRYLTTEQESENARAHAALSRAEMGGTGTVH